MCLLQINDTIYHQLHDKFSFSEEIKSICDSSDIDYDPRMAELFAAARSIFTNLSMELFDKEGNVSTYEDLVKILHVFILPEVQFHVKNRRTIHGVFEAMENECQMVEMMINKKVNKKRMQEESLDRQRRSLVKTDQLLGHLNDIYVDDEFFRLLSKHLEKDVKKLEDNMVSLSDKIVHLKQCTSENNYLKLSNARHARTRYVKEKEKLVITKEELKYQANKNTIGLKQSKLFSPKPANFMKNTESTRARYISESRELDNINEEIKMLINSKIKLSGVREAVHLTLNELDGDGVSYGYNKKKGALDAEADIFDPSKKPEEWMTLHEQVYKNLTFHNTKLKCRHDQFCSKIREQCQQLLINGGGTQTVDALPKQDSESKLTNRYSVRWLHGTVSKDECEKICKEVCEYTLDTAYSMADEIQGKDRQLITYHTNVYICYEKHVSESIMPGLGNVYRESFRSKCERLYEWIVAYAITELDFIDKWTDNLFPESREYGTTCLESTKGDRTRLSRSLENLSLDTIVNKLHTQTGSLTATFEQAWRIVAHDDNSPTENLNSVSRDSMIYTSFKDFFALVHQESKACSIFDKLRFLSRAVQFVEKHACGILKVNGHKHELSTDDVLDLLIMLVCKLDANCLLNLYADINMINHLTPSFLQGSMSQYCLITITGAYQHLFERQELHLSFRQSIE